VKTKTSPILILILALLLSGSGLAQERQPLRLSLEDCIAKALKNNLNVAVEQMNPELADISITRAKEMFLPRFELSYGSDHQETPSYWWLQGQGTSLNKMRDYGFSIVEAVPTGASVSLSLQSYKSDTNQAFQLINPRYGSTLRLDFSQPLLKDFGPKIARRQVLLAENNLDISQLQLRSTMMDTVYLVQEAYWNYVFAIENYDVKKQSLQLGRDLLNKSRKEVEFGQLAPIEVLSAESIVASRNADLIQAEGLIARSEEVLKSIINLAAEGDSRLKKVVPVDKPEYMEMSVGFDQAFKDAMERRPDLKILQKSIEAKDLNLSVARNQTLPALDLKLSYWSPGIGGDRLLYLDDNPFAGVIIGKQPGNPGDALKDALKFRYSNWNVGLTLSIPLSTFTTKADLTYAKMDLGQSQVRLKSLEQQVALEVSDAVRTIETNAKRVEAYRVARELAEKSLDGEEKKLKVGLSTNYFVLDFQEKLANARSAEVKAKIDFILSVERLERARGLSLDKRTIKIEGSD
jgi:outer membrane protein TolC